ncbi:MAG: HDOD domain-containing protein [bacterium]
MLSFLRRLFGGSAKGSGLLTPPAGRGDAAPLAGSSASPRQTTRARASTAVQAEPAVPDEKLLQDELRERLAASLRKLDDALMGEHRRSNDVVLLMRALRQDPIAGIRQLPVAAQRALALLHGEAPTKMLVDLLERDPAMAQALLRQVNSTYYNPSGTHILSLADAINRMGRVGVQSVVFEQSLTGMVSRPGGDLDAMAQQVWNHMVRTAPIARQLAPAFDVAPDEAFLLGLLHDVGKLVVFDRITELRGTQRRPLTVDRRDVSRALRLIHEPLGGLVVQQWGLESGIARAIGSHHREPVPAARDGLCEVIYVAERVDLAQNRKEAPDLEAIWSAGELTGDRAAVAEILGIVLSS